MDNATRFRAEQYAATLDSGADDETVTAAASTLDEALHYDPTGDDFVRAVLQAAITEEIVDRTRAAATIRAVLGL